MVKLQSAVLILVLVAATLSTSSHARGLTDHLVDIFKSRHSHSTASASSIPSNNPPSLNSEISTYSPYRECIQSCKSCACTQVWPPDLSLCLCLDPGKYRRRTVPVPYKECKKSCQSACACTLVYPLELSQCICLNPSSQQVHDANAITFQHHNYIWIEQWKGKRQPASYDSVQSQSKPLALPSRNKLAS